MFLLSKQHQLVLKGVQSSKAGLHLNLSTYQKCEVLFPIGWQKTKYHERIRQNAGLPESVFIKPLCAKRF
jgi:hypothetical protein